MPVRNDERRALRGQRRRHRVLLSCAPAQLEVEHGEVEARAAAERLQAPRRHRRRRSTLAPADSSDLLDVEGDQEFIVDHQATLAGDEAVVFAMPLAYLRTMELFRPRRD